MSLFTLASADKNSKTSCSMVEAVPAQVANTWSIQEAMLAMEPHTFSTCANRQKDTETAGLPTSHKPPNSSLTGGRQLKICSLNHKRPWERKRGLWGQN
ncbi:hypothetical protein E2C01_052748 [Portunus trituberculatus]|uniref:Uncharacterized protein n=1 Tax=Portunus trituberculatus TaxID=210409 RepID=A0A5B7GMB0_PORTR|nr:hypothetical protein [Portunus trituberculatus]